MISSLHDINWTPAYLRAFEGFLSKNTYHIQEVLADPGLLKVNIDYVVRNAETQSPQSSQISQNPNEAEHVEHEESGQAN